ncbi:MAG TPA: hypothetical protein VF276_09940 [Chloroflexia bacterium]
MSTRSMTTPTRHTTSGVLPQPAVLQRWMQQRRFRQAQARAYVRFAAAYPVWVESLFDAHFLSHAAAPALAQYAATAQRPTAGEIALLWAAQFIGVHYQPTQAQFADAVAVAGAFLDYLAAELQ